MAGKFNQPSATSFFQPISHDKYIDQLRGTVPIGLSPPPVPSQNKKREKDRLRNQLKMKASRDRKKTKEIEEGKQDLEGHIIKQNQNVFDSLSLGGKASNTHLGDMALTTNSSQEGYLETEITSRFHQSFRKLSLPTY